jgi:hypothetical protein
MDYYSDYYYYRDRLSVILYTSNNIMGIEENKRNRLYVGME